ncbi:MAG TPA: glycosyltransferase [Bacteroidetes bacterium]|nr:glycosyltransferase [Bacteroidota bacterium]
MPDISIIIVNYNVRYFLEQCLLSIQKGGNNLNVEIIVVDNNSVDDSVEYIKQKFPNVNLIANKTNVGFAKANNQAIKVAKAKYVLLLNPDTLIEEDTLEISFKYMEQHLDVGALGVKLIDGEGKFLPESKRGFPTLAASFFRLTGLSKIFPRSKVFNKYNLGFIDEDSTSEVDVLCGAFMFVRRSILNEVGLLDEDFFMYGEDIDFSYRIKQAGYKIIYLPETKIIHFKGESTKKSSLKYHNIFYKAMAIFAKKHYGKSGFNPLLILINISVFFLIIFNYLKHILKKYFSPILDFVLFFLIFFLVQKFWANYHFHDPNYYDLKKTSVLFTAFSLVYVISIYSYGGYRKNRLINSIKGVLSASFTILVIYSLLPENMRYSRAIILISSIFNFVLVVLIRIASYSIFPFVTNKDLLSKKIAIVGDEKEVERVKRIMKISGISYSFLGVVSINSMDSDELNKDYLGTLDNIKELVQLNNLNEVIFCLKNIKMAQVINLMSEFGDKVSFKVVPEESHSIIGSSDRNSQGEFYTLDVNYKLNSTNIKLKYFLDKIVAAFLFVFYPFIKIFSKKLKLNDVFTVLSGNKTWVSYIDNIEGNDKLPYLKKGVFIPAFLENKDNSDNYLHDINVLYARNYSFWRDLEFLYKHIFTARKYLKV